MIQFLIMKGMEVNTLNKKGRPPLYPAAEHGYSEKVKILVENGLMLIFFSLVDNQSCILLLHMIN